LCNERIEMEAKDFWTIIDKVKDSEEPEEDIKIQLDELNPEEVVSYQEHFDIFFENAYRWDLWGAAYIIEGGCSDDGFTDFRYGLISQGKDVYEAALINPDNLAEFDFENELSNELFGYSALEVYEQKTGNETPRKKFEQPDDPTGEEWDFDNENENIKRLPRLWKKYGQ
jgi:hypothetical protein